MRAATVCFLAPSEFGASSFRQATKRPADRSDTDLVKILKAAVSVDLNEEQEFLLSPLMQSPDEAGGEM
jgi:hypothetical protein